MSGLPSIALLILQSSTVFLPSLLATDCICMAGASCGISRSRSAWPKTGYLSKSISLTISIPFISS